MQRNNQNADQDLGKEMWSYKEATIIVMVFFAIGMIIEWLNGISTLPYISYPTNLYLGLGFISVLLVLYFFFHHHKWLQFVKSVPVAVLSVGYFAFITLLMGMFMQAPRADGIIAVLSLNKVTDSWYFLFAHLFILTSLGFLVIDKIVHFKWKNAGILISHLGLWIVLFAGSLGSFEITRLEMELTEGEITGRAINKAKSLDVNMPFALYLKDFRMLEYSPKLGIVDNEAGKLWHKQGQNIRILDQDSIFQIEDWQIQITNYLDYSGKSGDEYYFYKEIGSPPAAKIRVVNTMLDTIEGWISCGSFNSPYESLKLNDKYSLIMLFPEPKNYISEVELFTKEGKQAEFDIEVNKPFEYKGWKIYQLSFDDEFGKWSNKSTVELVRDPWLPLVYLGIFLMICGAFYLFWFGRSERGFDGGKR